MAGSYPGDAAGTEDERLSSLRSSLISPNTAYLQQQAQQQQQWQQGAHSSSWVTSPGTADYDFNNSYSFYQQQQPWMFEQYPQFDGHGFTPQHDHWGNYEAQGQQALSSCGHDVSAMGKAAAGHQPNTSKMVSENKTQGSQGYEAPNNSVASKKQPLPGYAGHVSLRTDNGQVKTLPLLTEHELQKKRAAAIASLQKRAESTGTTGRDNTPSRDASQTPTQTLAEGSTTLKEDKPNGPKKALFQAGDKTQSRREISSTERSSPAENTAVYQHARPSQFAAVEKTPSEKTIRTHMQYDGNSQDGKMHAKASSIDIDGLLAEGRAAAEASVKATTNGKQASGKAKARDAKVDPHRRNSRRSAVSPGPSEVGEIRDEAEDHVSSHSRPKGSVPKEHEASRQKSQNSGPSNGLSKNPTTKTDTFNNNDKGSKKDTTRVGNLEKRHSGTDTGVPKKSDATAQASSHNSSQPSQRKDEKTSVSKVEPRSTERLKTAQGPPSRSDQPTYDPARDSSRYKGSDQPSKGSKENEGDSIMKTRRASRPSAVEDGRCVDNPTPVVGTKSSPDNTFAHLDPHEAEELKEWLVMTGYYDETFRRNTVNRLKRLAELEREKAELLKEDQEERGALTTARANSLVSLDAPGTPATPSLSYLATMLPPNIGHKQDKASRALDSSDDRIDTPNDTDGASRIDDSRASRIAPSKRRLSASEGHYGDPKPAEKLARTGYDTHIQGKRGSSQDTRQTSSRSRHHRESKECDDDGRKLTKGRRTLDGMNEERCGVLDRHRSPGSRSPARHGKESDYDRRYSRESNKMRADWLESPERGDSRSIPSRGRGRGRFHRGSHRDSANFNSHRSDRKDSGDGLDLHLGNVQYFLVKSWTHDNVEISQREGTWATQAKNVERFLNAFEERRHVILVFSVNTSGAFQGYARMETRPGAKGVRTPSWVDDLLWEASPPFKIRWISVNETRFEFIHHLKNKFNDNAPVLFGRDGQEIEPGCGQSLCEIIADHDPNNQSWAKPRKPTS